MIKRFGGPWKYEDPEIKQVDTPVGDACCYCEELIEEGDSGVIVPSITEGATPFHADCYVRWTVGSVAHIEMRCSCYVEGAEEGDDPSLTRREAAKAAVAALRKREEDARLTDEFYAEMARAAEHPECVRCGECCKASPCGFGEWDEKEGKCKYLAWASTISFPMKWGWPPTQEPSITLYRCSIAEEIMKDPTSEISPAFGAGCCRSLFNEVRARIIRLGKGRRYRGHEQAHESGPYCY